MNPNTQASISVVHTARAYTRAAIILHWTLALLLIAMIALGWYMTSIEDDPGSDWYFSLHKSFGLVIAALIAARVVWRLTHRPQDLPAGLARWQAGLSRWTQTLLYIVMVLMPATGYLGASYSKAGLQLFGASTPRWALPNQSAAEWLFGIHSVLVWVLVGLIVLHVMGAMKHLLIDGDDVFQRMWFRL